MYFNLSYFQSDQSSIFLFNILLYSKRLRMFSKYDSKIIFFTWKWKELYRRQTIFSETSCRKIGNTINKYALTKSDEIATKQFEEFFETLSKRRYLR
jgi:hypothetical protein